MDFDGALLAGGDKRARAVWLVPEPAHQVGLGLHHAAVLHQHQEQVKLGAGQVQRYAVEGGGPGSFVQRQAFMLKIAQHSSRCPRRRRHDGGGNSRCRRVLPRAGPGCLRSVNGSGSKGPRTPEHGGDPCSQFAGPERLGQVIVGSGLEAHQRIRFVHPACDDDEVGVAEHPDPARGLDAVKIRQANVHGDNDGIVFPHGLHAFQAGGRFEHGKTGLQEHLL